MKIAMIDPSLFTLPYDHHLCQALHEQGNQVTLVGRLLRSGESLASGYPLMKHFYKRAEGMRGKSKLQLIIKVLEHMLNMNSLIRELRRLNPDVIHFQWFPIPLVDRFFEALGADRSSRVDRARYERLSWRPFFQIPDDRLA